MHSAPLGSAGCQTVARKYFELVIGPYPTRPCVHPSRRMVDQVLYSSQLHPLLSSLSSLLSSRRGTRLSCLLIEVSCDLRKLLLPSSKMQSRHYSAYGTGLDSPFPLPTSLNKLPDFMYSRPPSRRSRTMSLQAPTANDYKYPPLLSDNASRTDEGFCDLPSLHVSGRSTRLCDYVTDMLDSPTTLSTHFMNMGHRQHPFRPASRSTFLLWIVATVNFRGTAVSISKSVDRPTADLPDSCLSHSQADAATSGQS